MLPGPIAVAVVEFLFHVYPKHCPRSMTCWVLSYLQALKVTVSLALAASAAPPHDGLESRIATWYASLLLVLCLGYSSASHSPDCSSFDQSLAQTTLPVVGGLLLDGSRGPPQRRGCHLEDLYQKARAELQQMTEVAELGLLLPLLSLAPGWMTEMQHQRRHVSEPMVLSECWHCWLERGTDQVRSLEIWRSEQAFVQRRYPDVPSLYQHILTYLMYAHNWNSTGKHRQPNNIWEQRYLSHPNVRVNKIACIVEQLLY